MYNKFFSFYFFFKNFFFLNKTEKKFIKFNNLKWGQNKNSLNQEKKESIILVDLFLWYPLIYFWSYLVNLISLKEKIRIRFFYFHFYQSKSNNYFFYISKIKKIFRSFNVEEGLNEYKFIYNEEEITKYKKIFLTIKSKKKLLNFKIHNILIGDLIYDTFLRTALEPTIILNDPRLEKIFIRSLKIFYEVNDYFNKHNIKYVVPSHLCYLYGIISRIALKKKIKVFKVRTENMSSSSFQLIKVDKFCLDEQPYYKYKKEFDKFNKTQKVLALKKGKEIIRNRVKGQHDSSLPYMLKSQFRKSNKNIFIKKNTKDKIIIFPHCFYDYPHRYRSMIFPDFYEHAVFFMNFSKKLNQYDWYYKPHPNSLIGHINIHKKLIKKYNSVNYLDQDVSHSEILKLKPKCIITNHGTVAHEYAYFNIPVINTGDNPHINYKFCLNPKNKKELIKILLNLNYYSKKISFDKKYIYEFLYMHYDYYKNKYKRNELIKDSFFAYSKVENNVTSKVLDYIMKQDGNNSDNIKKYINNFLNSNLN